MPPRAKNCLGEDGATYELIGNVMLEAKKPDEAREAFEAIRQTQARRSRAGPQFGPRRSSSPATRKKRSTNCKNISIPKPPPKASCPTNCWPRSSKSKSKAINLISRLESLRTDQPDNVPLAYFLGEQYRQAGKLDKAAEALEKAMELKPNAQAYRALVDVYCQHRISPKPLLKLLATMVEKAGALALADDDVKKITGNEKLLAAILELAQKQHAAATADDRFPLHAAALLAIEAKRWNDAESLVEPGHQSRPEIHRRTAHRTGPGTDARRKIRAGRHGAPARNRRQRIRRRQRAAVFLSIRRTGAAR